MFKFPYDTQFCSLKFGNVLEPDELVKVMWELPEVDLGLFTPSNEFFVESHLVNKVSHTVSIATFRTKMASLSGVAVYLNAFVINTV